MKKILLAAVSLALCASVSAQDSLAKALCHNQENVMKVMLKHRTQGTPFRTALNTLSERNEKTREFLMRATARVYDHPDDARVYVDSGEFHKECLRVSLS